MKGSIHSDQTCPICGTRFKSVEPRGLFCPNHPKQSPAKFKVIFGKITRRFDNYPAALQFLTGLRFQDGSGQIDERDYQIKAKPLSFSRLVGEWLNIKKTTLKPKSWSAMAAAMAHAQKQFGEANIKSITFAHVQDFLLNHQAAPKTKANLLAFLKQFWVWAHDRYDVPVLKKWPDIGPVEMAYRKTLDLEIQDRILESIQKHEPFRVWLAIKWLATYISIRPGEMISLKEWQVDRERGWLIVPHPKEKKPKIVQLTAADLTIVRSLPKADDQTPFFRHEGGVQGAPVNAAFGPRQLYRAWKRATAKLGIYDVDLYGGTKHSTAMGLDGLMTPEQVKALTMHTSKAFERYFRPKADYSAREKILNIVKEQADNGLTTGNKDQNNDNLLILH